MQRFVIVNADDFGLCTGVNKAIEDAHKNGILTSATIMANMPSASEAVEIAKRTPSLGVGVHLNLTNGIPLSKHKSVEYIKDDTGNFGLGPYKLALKTLLNRNVRQAVETELAAQIKWVIDQGIKPTHLDSHKHIHAFPPIFPIVCDLAKQFGIRAIRWTFEPAKIGFGFRPVTKKDRHRSAAVRNMARINRRQNSEFFKNNILLGIAHTGKIDHDFFRAAALNPLGTVTEIMTHPGYMEGLDLKLTTLIEERKLEFEAICARQTRDYFNTAGIKLLGYGQIE